MIERLSGVVSATFAHLPGDKRCLTRSMVLVELLARRGVPATLVLGVRAGDVPFAAHAWVTVAGQDVLPRGQFEVLAEL